MPERDIAYCHACGSPMDVSVVGPFTNVECPGCAKHTRVKREFGPYTLVRRLATGGMSLVFVANDNTLGREVVVKILNEAYSADEKRINAFEEEARVTASISHPNVVRVFTTGRAFGRFFIAMELVPGGHFEHHIRERGSIPEVEALPLALEVTEGLKAAHQVGLIHRDVKPGNILLDANGNAKLVDFGLALVTKGGSATASEIWATPYYVPPEAIDGQAEDFRSDIYAFGATFYHALAGKPPCDEETMDTKRLKVAKQKLIPLAEVAPWVGPATGAVIDRCMAYEPDQRYASYADLIAALRSAQQQIPSGPIEPGGRSGGRGGHGKRKVARPALAAGALLVAGAVGLTLNKVFFDATEPEIAAVPETESLTPDPLPEADVGRTGLQVAAVYREGAEALAARDFSRARERFLTVARDPGVLEPTGSWAAAEAVLGSLFAGDSAAARDDARGAIEHLESAEGLGPVVRDKLIAALKSVLTLPPVAGPADFEGGGADYLVWLLAGLKNWDQGMPDVAEPFLKAVKSAETGGRDQWLEPYRALAGAYLADLERLRQAEPERFDLPPDACRELIDELHAVQASLETEGRAKFNVRSWQLELEKQARRSAESEAPTVVPGPRPSTLAADFSACRFSKALRSLKAWQPEDPAGREERRALILLAEAAAAFLADLAERLQGAAVENGVATRDGSGFPVVRGGTTAGLEVIDATGEQHRLEWGEIDPNSLIDLHRALIRSDSASLDRLVRNEQAVAFDLLAGDPERARAAAARLAEGSASFRRRWEGLLDVVVR